MSKIGSPTAYGEVKVSSSGGQPILVPSSGITVFDWDKVTRRWIDLGYEAEGLGVSRCIFRAPAQTFTKIHPSKKVHSIDLSPGSELAVSGGEEGSVRVWNVREGTIQREMTGHMGDVNSVRFFPSGEVVLSAGADTMLKIWRVEDALCGATLKGHTAGVLGTAIVDRGRNVLSCSRDGSVKLWDCGSQSVVTEVTNRSCAVNAVHVHTNTAVASTEPAPADGKEFGTEGKIVTYACEDGTLAAFDLRAKKEVFTMKHRSALNACFGNGDIILGGGQDGSLLAFDLRNTSSSLPCPHRGEAPITAIQPSANAAAGRVWVATGDGSCFLCECTTGQVLEDLTGPDWDPVYAIAVNGRFVLTTSRDGLIRKYMVA